MGGMAALGSFAGGLAGGYNTSENDKSMREYRGALTGEVEQKTATEQEHQAALREYGAQLKQWREGGGKGPAPVAPVGDASSGALPAASGTAAPSTSAAPAAANPAAGRMKVAQFLQAGGFGVLANAVAPGGQVTDPAQAAAQPAPAVPMVTGPSDGMSGYGS